MTEFLDHYVTRNYYNEMKDVFKLIFPDADEEKVNAFIEQKMRERIKEPSIRLENNYTNKFAQKSGLDFTDWMDKSKPVMTEHGVLFKNQHKAQNPPADLLADILTSRKVEKKAMLKAKDSGDRETAKYHDIRQKAFKIFANSWFGISGQSSSFIYNIFVALSITGKGQSIISTSTQAFEQFLAGNIIFRNLDDCLRYVMLIRNDKYVYNDAKILDSNVDRKTVLQHLISKFKNPDDVVEHKEVLVKLIKSLSQRELNRVYYRNNLSAFFQNSKITKILVNIIDNKEDYVSSEHPPESMQKDLSNLWKLCDDFIFHKHATHDRVKLLKEEKRKAVITINHRSFMTVMSYRNSFNFGNCA